MEELIKAVDIIFLGIVMELEIRKKTEKELVFKILGEDHTLGNLVAKMVLRHPNVELAAYTIEHPLDGQPIVRIITDGSKDPVEVLMESLRNVKEITERLLNIVKDKLSIEE